MKNKLTAIIVTFLRDDYLAICLESMRKTYPDINILVGDNGHPSDTKKALCDKYGAEYHTLPFDCGLCTARNYLVSKVTTRYVMIGDDDFKYDDRAMLQDMVDFLEDNTRYDLVGGRIIEGGSVKNYQGMIEDKGNHFIYHKLQFSEQQSFIPCDITFNFFVARKEAVQAVKWDEQIKVAYEHSTFFIDFKRAGYKTCFLPQALVEHKPQLSNVSKENHIKLNEYKGYRSRKSDKRRFFERFGIEFCIDMNGRRDSFDSGPTNEIDFCITTFERFDHLERLLLSISHYYPNASILIADQSYKFAADDYFALYDKCYQAGLKNKPTAYNLEHDCGLSHARNFLVNKSMKPYQLVLEDDFVFTDQTKIEKLLGVLEAKQHIAVIGGAVSEHDYILPFVHNFKLDDKTLYHVPCGDDWRQDGGCNHKIVDCIPNFFLARKQLWSDMQWDDEIKIEGEHTDFFYRLWQMDWMVAYTDQVVINHEKDNSQEYKDMRKRCHLKIMLLKNNLQKIVYQDGYIIELIDGEVRKG